MLRHWFYKDKMGRTVYFDYLYSKCKESLIDFYMLKTCCKRIFVFIVLFLLYDFRWFLLICFIWFKKVKAQDTEELKKTIYVMKNASMWKRFFLKRCKRIERSPMPSSVRLFVFWVVNLVLSYCKLCNKFVLTIKMLKWLK